MSKLSSFDLKQRISALNRLDPRKVSYDTLIARFSSLTVDVEAVVGTNGGELFFRARVNPASRPDLISDLGPPPAALVTGFQRCNRPGHPMFYTASRRITALLESRVAVGDIVYLSQWIGHEGLPINKSFDDSEKTPEGRTWSNRSQAVYAYFDTIFTRRIHSTFSQDYIFTAAATHQFTANFPVGNFNIKDNGFVGLRYPSVVDIERSYNTVFHPEQFQEFDLLHVAEMEITEVSDDDVQASLLDTALVFADGKIAWSGDKGQMPALRQEGKAVPFRYSGTEWRVQTLGRDMTAEEFSAFLAE